MIFTAQMVHLTAVVLRSRAEPVSQALLRSGAVHLDRLRDVAPSAPARLRDTSLETQQRELAEVRRRIEGVLSIGGQPMPAPRAADTWNAPDLDSLNATLDRIAGDIQQLRKRQGELQQEINRTEEVQRRLGSSPLAAGTGQLIAEAAGDRFRFLDIRYGVLPAANLERADRVLGRLSGLVARAGGEAPGEAAVLVVSMKRNSAEVSEALSDLGFRRQEPPAGTSDGGGREPGARIAERANERLRELRAEQSEQEAKIKALVSSRREELDEEWRVARTAELLAAIRNKTSESEHATVFTGWVPKRLQRGLDAEIREAAGDACVLEWHSTEEMSVESSVSAPVELRNPQFLRPFQMLVTNYGTPAYGTVDPTPLVAVAYLAMFGLMFGDAGHGAVLVLLGLFGRRLLTSRSMRELANLLVWCGGASVVTGVLFGAYFGFELLPPLWFNYHGVVAGHAAEGPVRNLMDILALTVYLGVGVIGAGILLNWVNLVRARRWRMLVFDKAGVLGGVIYAAGVWVAAGFAQSGFKALPNLSIAGWLIGVPSLLLFLKFPLEARARARAHLGAAPQRPSEHSSSPAMWVMDWIIELLEVFSGYLANTLSFMRVAGLGIAHVMLMVAFFQIAQMISPSGYTPVSILVLVAGNVLVIGLEGLSAGIQSLRLNYYEFFSKYFVPTGTAYRPVSLTN